MTSTVLVGDCVARMAELAADSMDSIVTDPPYELGFMGKAWDRSGVAFQVSTWEAAYRVLKPGGYLLAFGGTRTYHRMVVAIEDAGFEIRDTIMWVYGTGFPKSLDVSKAIDKAAGAERRETGKVRTDGRGASPQKLKNHGVGDTGVGHADGSRQQYNETAPATSDAEQWSGWGTALKPACEPIVLARKPFPGTVAANVLRHGTGALNIDASRIGTEKVSTHSRGGNGAFPKRPRETSPSDSGRITDQRNGIDGSIRVGRWPANVILDEAAAAELDAQSGESEGSRRTGIRTGHSSDSGWGMGTQDAVEMGYDDVGGASRFFYVAKASRAERGAVNTHPTVKPIALLTHLIRLVTPDGGTVLDPFLGSGTTAIAALRLGMRVIGIEQSAEYAELSRRRIAADSPLWNQMEQGEHA